MKSIDPISPLELLDQRQDAKLRRDGYRTFAEWKAVGRHVIKGRTTRTFDSRGNALFHRNQTAVTEVPPYYGQGEEGDPDIWEADDFFGFDIMDFGDR